MNELNTGIEVITKIYNNKKTDDRYTSAVCFTNIHFVLLNCLCIVLFFLSFFFSVFRGWMNVGAALFLLLYFAIVRAFIGHTSAFFNGQIENRNKRKYIIFDLLK